MSAHGAEVPRGSCRHHRSRMEPRRSSGKRGNALRRLTTFLAIANLTGVLTARTIVGDMALRVPPQFSSQIQNLVDLPDERLNGFLDALASAGSKFNANDLALEVSDRTKLPRPMADGIVQLLTFLYKTREQGAIPLELFVDQEVAPGMKQLLARGDKEKDKSEEAIRLAEERVETRWAKIRKFLTTALVLNDTVGTAAKAGPVMTEHEKIFQDARILTDLRLIFHPDLSERPNAGVIVHMLRLTTRDVLGGQHAQYFALDANDIRFLKQLLDRAMKKEETLRTLMNSAAVDKVACQEVIVPISVVSQSL